MSAQVHNRCPWCLQCEICMRAYNALLESLKLEPEPLHAPNCQRPAESAQGGLGTISMEDVGQFLRTGLP